MQTATMQTAELKITRVNAVRAYNQATTKGKQLLSDLFGEENLKLDVKERVTSYADACQEVGILPLTISDFSAEPEEERESAYAYHQLKTIVKALNEGWKANYRDENQHKYYPYFLESAGGSGFSFLAYSCASSSAYGGARLSYKSAELAEYAGKQFIDIYNKFLQ